MTTFSDFLAIALREARTDRSRYDVVTIVERACATAWNELAMDEVLHPECQEGTETHPYNPPFSALHPTRGMRFRVLFGQSHCTVLEVGPLMVWWEQHGTVTTTTREWFRDNAWPEDD